jgi:hypothetical protein
MEFAVGRRWEKEASRTFERIISFGNSAARRKEAKRVLELKQNSEEEKKRKSVAASDIP